MYATRVLRLELILLMRTGQSTFPEFAEHIGGLALVEITTSDSGLIRISDRLENLFKRDMIQNLWIQNFTTSLSRGISLR